jgi:hypothetical protein
MGRSIPSITSRVDAKIDQWKRFSHTLRGKNREAYDELVKLMRDHRTEIDAADEADVSTAILLLVCLNLMGRLKHDGPKNGQNRLE